MKKRFTLIALILITILGTAIRFYQLGEAPAGLYIDEAGQGYSAYSILKTGKDEFGQPFPFAFRSFTDFKTPLYVYLVAPLIPIFDLTPFTVRFPSFFFSVLTFPLLFLILRKISPQKYQPALPLLATLLLAISPWHTLFGRTNFECNVALFLLLLAIYLFYLGLEKSWVMVPAAITAAVALPSYHSERLLVPLIGAILLWRFRKRVLTLPRRYMLIGAAAALIITLPTISVAATPGFLMRASGLNIFSQTEHKPAGYSPTYSALLDNFVNGAWFLSPREFLSLYASYFSPRFMFNLGDYGPRSSFPNLSTFFVWQFPFYLLGLYLFLKEKGLGELKFFTILLLLLAPIPAAVTRDPYSTIRALPMVIPQLIIIAFGTIQLYRFLKPSLRLVTVFILTILIIHSLLNLYSSVIVLNENNRAAEWDYGWEEVAGILKNRPAGLPAVVENVREEPYIELLFFLKYDPVLYQKENFEVPLAEYYTNMTRNRDKKIGTITTRAIVWEKDLAVDQYLVGDQLAISNDQIKNHKLTLIKDVLYPDRGVAFRIVRTNPEYELEERRKRQDTPLLQTP